MNASNSGSSYPNSMHEKYHRKTAHHATASMTSSNVSHLMEPDDMSKLYKVRISGSPSWQLHGQYAWLASGTSASSDLTDSCEDTAVIPIPVPWRDSLSSEASISGLRLADFAVLASLFVFLSARLLLPRDFALLDVELDRDSERRRCSLNVMLASAG